MTKRNTKPADTAKPDEHLPAVIGPQPATETQAGPKLVYAASAPVQSLPVRVPIADAKDGDPASKVEVIDLAPGKPWPLAADHKLTASMRAAGFLVAADETDPTTADEEDSK